MIKTKGVAAGFLFMTMLQLHSQGYIVPNGVYSGSVGFGAYEIDVIQNPANSDFTGFFLRPQGKTEPTLYTNTFSFFTYLDEGVRVFLVSSNQPMSLSPILAQSYPELSFPNTYVFRSGTPFYLGLYTGYLPSGPNNGIYSDPLFGWAKLVNNQGVIQLLDSALVFGGGGIYVGTQNIIPVPEPSAIFLTALGALLLGIRRWRRGLTPP